MPGPILVLFGAGLTVFTAWRLGRMLLGRSRECMGRSEFELLAAVAGCALLSLIVFFCCAFHIARPAVFVAIAIAIAATSFAPGIRIHRKWRDAAPPLTIACKLLFGVPWATWLAVYLANSLAPEMSPDGMAYHLGLVSRYARQSGFELLTTNMYEHLSKGMEMLYLFAFSFGAHAAAATVHCAFLLALPWMMLAYSRRIGKAWAGICAAMLVYLSPIVGVDGSSAYNDVALAAAAFALFYLLEIWRFGPSKADLPLLCSIGAVAGYCFAIKFTGAVAVLYAALVILMARRPRALVPVLASAALIALPWPARNWVWTGNPAAPFFNRTFSNPYIHASFETAYRRYFATYNLPEFRSLPWKLTVSGELGGQIGPVFLLAPVALFSLRSAPGRRCLLALLFFLLPYPANIGARFLIPALPFLALTIGLGLSFSRPLLSALVIIAAVLAWPRMIRQYRAPAGGWQISTVPWKPALGITPPAHYLEERSADYRIAQMIDRNVPPRKRVLSTTPVAEAYERPDVLVTYQSAEGESLEDILSAAIETDRQPLWNLRFTFAPRVLPGITFEQITQASDIWSIGEVKFFRAAAEISPGIRRTNAKPFPWDARLAIDANPLTRWKSWDSARPGMYWSAEFARPAEIDRAELHCAHDQWAINVRIRGIDATLEKVEQPHFGDLRPLATQTVKARGIDYLLTAPASRLHAAFSRDAHAWRIDPIAQQDGATLYRIE